MDPKRENTRKHTKSSPIQMESIYLKKKRENKGKLQNRETKRRKTDNNSKPLRC